MRIVQGRFDFPWLHAEEFDAYREFQQSHRDLPMATYGTIIFVLPLLTFRCDLGIFFLYNVYQRSVILCGLVAIGCSTLHMTLVNKALTLKTLKTPTKCCGILADVVTITSTLSAGLHLIGRVANGACPPDATLMSSQGCVPHGRVPLENVLALYLIPIVCVVIVRGVSLAVELGALCMSMAFTAFALQTTGEFNLHVFTILYGLMSLLVMLEYERAWRLSFRSASVTKNVLGRVFPPHVASALLSGESVQPTRHKDVCVFVSDIVNYTEMTDMLGADSTLKMVDAIYRVMDDLVDQFPGKLWKMETSGDSYMVECGAVYAGRSLEENCATVLDFALLVQRSVSDLAVFHEEFPVQLRIGVHCGSCSAGLVGSHKHMPHFSLFGNLVNATSRVETTCSPGMIHVSDAVVQSIKGWNSSRALQYETLFHYRGPVDLKGLGWMNTWWLTTPWDRMVHTLSSSSSSSSSSSVTTRTPTPSTSFETLASSLQQRGSSYPGRYRKPSPLVNYLQGGNVLGFRFDVRVVPTDLDSLVDASFDIFAGLFSFDHLRVNPVTLKSFLRKVGQKYNNVKYHNFHHAFSVTQFTAALYKQCIVDTTEIKTSMEMTMFASMIAVICHDVGHDGLNNTFHVNNKSPLAKTYFNQSPLENMHISTTLSCLGTHGCNVFENWSQAFVDFARNLISNSLLATDMLLHDQVLQDLLSYDPALLTSSLYNFDSASQGTELAFHAEQYELLRLSRLMLHAADISNTVRPFAISAHYTDKLVSEFGMQVQREKELGLPVAPFMVIPDEQAKARGEIYFLRSVARPYFAALAKAIPACQELVSTLDDNVVEWEKIASN